MAIDQSSRSCNVAAFLDKMFYDDYSYLTDSCKQQINKVRKAARKLERLSTHRANLGGGGCGALVLLNEI